MMIIIMYADRVDFFAMLSEVECTYMCHDTIVFTTYIFSILSPG